MKPASKRYWHELTTKDFAALDAENMVAIFPVGAIEQHGPHLPVWSDTRIGQGIVEELVRIAPADLPFLVLPTQSVGRSEEHDTFPGTLSLRSETLKAVCVDILESVRRAGIRKVIVFNSHGGNPPVIDLAGLEMRRRQGMLVASTIWYQLGFPPGDLFSAYETSYGTHAGEIETSMMLHLAPGLVDDGERAVFSNRAKAMSETYEVLDPQGAAPFSWITPDLSDSGAWGNAAAADAARGRTLIEYYGSRLLALVRDVHRFPLSSLAPATAAAG